MSLSHLGRALHSICVERHTNARLIAQNARLHHTLLSRAANGGRLETKSLRALCMSQPDAETAMRILIGHLRDEIERAGRSISEIRVEPDGRALGENLLLLVEEAGNDPELQAVLDQLADFVRTHPRLAERSGKGGAKGKTKTRAKTNVRAKTPGKG